MTILPRLRPLDIRPILHRQKPALVVRDPLELSDRYLIVPQVLGPALLLCDGTRDAAAITAALRSDYGLRIEQSVVEELITALDEACFLANERAEDAQARALAAYRAAPFRPMTIAGQGYPAEAGALRREFDAYLEAAAATEPAPSTGRAVISPHIDYARGHRVYARVWKTAAAMAQAAELVIILGTDHYGGHNPVTLTRQSYATPYGVLPTELTIVDALAEALGPDRAFAGELYHRREHSLELVLIWLHHMRQGHSVPVVPILVGSFQPFLEDHPAPTPAATPVLQTLLERLTALADGRRTLVVASGDLAHIGPAFGGAPVGLIERAELHTHDETLLGLLATGDAEGFWRFIHAEQDRYNVCGVAPFYLLLKHIGATEGQRAGYAVCPADERNTSVVSIGGMVFG